MFVFVLRGNEIHIARAFKMRHGDEIAVAAPFQKEFAVPADRSALRFVFRNRVLNCRQFVFGKLAPRLRAFFRGIINFFFREEFFQFFDKFRHFARSPILNRAARRLALLGGFVLCRAFFAGIALFLRAPLNFLELGDFADAFFQPLHLCVDCIEAEHFQAVCDFCGFGRIGFRKILRQFVRNRLAQFRIRPNRRGKHREKFVLFFDAIFRCSVQAFQLNHFKFRRRNQARRKRGNIERSRNRGNVGIFDFDVPEESLARIALTARRDKIHRRNFLAELCQTLTFRRNALTFFLMLGIRRFLKDFFKELLPFSARILAEIHPRKQK